MHKGILLGLMTVMRNTTLSWSAIEVEIWEGLQTPQLSLFSLPVSGLGDRLMPRSFLIYYRTSPYSVDARTHNQIMGSSSSFQISRLTIFGRDGNDWLINGTYLPSTQIGGNGNDDLEGGSAKAWNSVFSGIEEVSADPPCSTGQSR